MTHLESDGFERSDNAGTYGFLNGIIAGIPIAIEPCVHVIPSQTAVSTALKIKSIKRSHTEGLTHTESSSRQVIFITSIRNSTLS